MGVGEALTVSVCIGVGLAEGDAIVVVVGVGLTEGDALAVAIGVKVDLISTPLFQTNFFPDFMQVNLFP